MLVIYRSFFFYNFNYYFLYFWLFFYFFKLKKKIYFFKNKFFFLYFLILINKLKYLEKFYLFNFIWFKFNLFSGLGFKKKLSKKKKYIYLFLGNRHWVIVPLFNIIIFPFKRRNFILFSNSKTKLYYYNNLFKELRKNSIFKLKGYLDIRTKRRWLFVRRLKIKNFKLKLSKKQKLI